MCEVFYCQVFHSITLLVIFYVVVSLQCAICGYVFQDLSADSLIQQVNNIATNVTLPPIPFDYCPQCNAPSTKYVVDSKRRAYVCGVCAYTVPFDKSVSDDAILMAAKAEEDRQQLLQQRLDREAAAKRKREEEANIIKCPKCGSTAITTGARGLNGMMGFWGASKTVNRCAKCGNTWTPKLR